MADRHAKPDPCDLEEPPGIPGYVEPIFGRVELVLRLVTLNLAAGIDDEGDDLPALFCNPFHPEDRGHRTLPRPFCDGPQRQFLLRQGKWEHFKTLPPQTRKVGFREAHDFRPPARSFGQELLDLVQSLIEG